MATAVDCIPLDLLRSGELAKVASVVGPPDECHRIEELGLRSGTTVEMVREGEPFILRVDGAKFCFRLTRACCVLVERIRGVA